MALFIEQIDKFCQKVTIFNWIFTLFLMEHSKNRYLQRVRCKNQKMQFYLDLENIFFSPKHFPLKQR